MLLVKSLPIRETTYVKNPLSSSLGEQIIVESISLINLIGLESFTFKKLADNIQSTEASVYRYFTNKHMLLVYLHNLYWRWLDSRIKQLSFERASHSSRLEKAIRMIVEPYADHESFVFPFKELSEVITAEGPKVYLTKAVDEDNKEGVFMEYKSLCDSLAQLVLNINPKYKYAHSLASTIVESAHDQLFFSKHLPRLTDIEENDVQQLYDYLIHTVRSAIK